VVPQLRPGEARGDRDVVVRTGVHAVQAEGAVRVADLERLEERQLTPPLNDLTGGVPAPPDAVVRGAGRADVGIRYGDLQRRHHRRGKVVLPERADVLAEGSVAEEP